MRHGETTGDIEQRFGGDYDDSLTAKGKHQAQKRAKTFKHLGIRAVISSPRKRAQESAKLVAKALGMPYHVVNNWKERNFYGPLTGMTRADAQAKHPELVKLVTSHMSKLPQSEGYDTFKKRILEVFSKTQAMNNDPVVIVTHGGPITCIARELLGKEVKVHDCGFLKLSVDATGVKLEAMESVEFKK